MKKFRVRFINEGSLMQPATVSGNTTQEEMNKDTEQMEQDQENEVVANSVPTLTPQQVADMSDGEVLSNFYLNPTSDLPEDAYQALQTRAGDFANKVRVGNVTPDEMKKTSNAIAANNAKIQNPIGESTDWMVSHIENVLLGKKGEKGRMGEFVWNGKDLYEETDEEEDGKTHYWNEWVGSFDRPSKTIYLNPEASTMVWNKIVTAGRNLKWNLKKTQNRKPRVDMGFEGDDDPLFTEAYSSGRVDGGDEYDFSGSGSWFDDDKKTFEEFCLDLSWELGANIERELGIPESKTYKLIDNWIQENREWVRERFGMHDEVTESDIIRARKKILPLLSKNFSKK